MKTITLMALGFAATFLSEAKARDAKQILDTSGVTGGLILVLGCGSPALLAKLRANDSYLVGGLDRDPEKVAVARTYLREKGLYGRVTAARWDGSQLPYVGSLVNMIVLTGDARQVSRDELMRVLAPGVAHLRNPADCRDQDRDRRADVETGI